MRNRLRLLIPYYFCTTMSSATLSFSQLLELVLKLPSEQRARLQDALRANSEYKPKQLKAADVSFRQSRKKFEGRTVSVSDALLDERRNAL